MVPSTQPINPIQRMRITFCKGGAARYTSHLDLARALERALNRAGLPVAYTQGFNRHPRLSLAAALPLGYTSDAEVADVWLVEEVQPEAFRERLQQAMPPGIALKDARSVALSEPSLQQQMAESVYEVRFLDPVEEVALRSGVAGLLAAESIPHERARAKNNKPQIIDLRPLILEVQVLSISNDSPYLLLHLVQTATRTGRPDDVLAALGYDPLDVHVHRIALRFAGSTILANL